MSLEPPEPFLPGPSRGEAVDLRNGVPAADALAPPRHLNAPPRASAACTIPEFKTVEMGSFVLEHGPTEGAVTYAEDDMSGLERLRGRLDHSVRAKLPALGVATAAH